MRSPQGFEQHIIATAKIEGLPTNCPSEATESAVESIEPTVNLIDEFSVARDRIKKVSLSKLAAALRSNKNHYGYIIEYFPWQTPESVRTKKVKLIVDYLVRTLGLDRRNFRIVFAETDSAGPRRYVTKLYTIPPGVSFPNP